MEKFILLFRGSNVYQPNQSPEALQALKIKMMDWLTGLSKNGQHIGSEQLQRSGKQVSGTMKTVTAYPFGGAKEMIGGCTIILANDFNEALEIAKACPILSSDATIEIRPVQSV